MTERAPGAEQARARLIAPPEAVVYGDGRVETQVWMALWYGPNRTRWEPALRLEVFRARF